MKKTKKVLIVSLTAAVLTGTAMVITGLLRGFGSKLILDCTIIVFSVNVFIVFLSYVIYKREKQKEIFK